MTDVAHRGGRDDGDDVVDHPRHPGDHALDDGLGASDDDGTETMPRSTGADLEVLFAECDAAALPRQHAWAYLDASFAVDDIQALERTMGGRGEEGLDGELGVDPAGLARALEALPLADLLGLSREYKEHMHGMDDAAPQREREQDEDEDEERAGGTEDEGYGAVAWNDAGADRTKENAREEGGRGGPNVGAHTTTAAVMSGPPLLSSSAVVDDAVDALLGGNLGDGPSGGQHIGAAVGTKPEDDDLDDLLGMSRGVAGGSGGQVPVVSGRAGTVHADDLFLDELLG